MPPAFSINLFARLRLITAIATGLLCYCVLPASLGTLQRLLMGWNVIGWIYLLALWWVMLRTEGKQIIHIARRQDQSAMLVLSMVTLACLASIVAILLELPALKNLTGSDRTLHLLLTATTLIVSWALLPSTFAMHYAHQHYLQRNDDVTPMMFPEKPADPEYWDFLYYAFTIAVAAQTADVATGTTAMRKITLLQSVIAFLFNLAVLGLSVNVAAGLLS